MKSIAAHYSQPLLSRDSLPPLSSFNYFYLFINSSGSIPLYSPRLTKIQHYLIFYRSPTILLPLSFQGFSVIQHQHTHPSSHKLSHMFWVEDFQRKHPNNVDELSLFPLGTGLRRTLPGDIVL